MGKKKTIKAPQRRDYATEMRQALEAQASVAGMKIGLERQWAPQFQALNRDMLSSQISNLGVLMDQAKPLAERLSAMDAEFMDARLPGLTRTAMGAYEAGMGESANILKTAERQAGAELALGRSLSPQEISMAQQAARAATTSRGLTGGNQAVMQEVLENWNVATNRENARRTFAANTVGLRQGALNSALSAYGQPLLASLVSNSPGGILNSANAMMKQPNVSNFTAESKMLADLITANQNNQMQAQIFNASQKSGTAGAVLGTAGGIIGAVYGGPQGAAAGYSIGSGLGNAFS